MKTILSCLVILVILINILNPSRALFILPNYTNSIESKQFLYPNHTEQLDIIWRFDHSIRLEIKYFELDGQSGDFILISDLPLTFEDSFLEFNGTEELPPFLPESIITNQGLLLSWKANATIEILSDYGTFIYFHAEKAPDRGKYPYQGFNITIRDLDEMRKPPSTTTPEPIVNTPEPQTAIYISKFLSCNEPQKFLEEKDTFKQSIAKIASQYCNETFGCKLSSDLNWTEISIPSGSGLHYCDPLWDVYETCVEVTFAIVRIENGKYLMPVQRLEDMWTKKANQIKAQGYCPYVPPETLAELNSWVWMAGMLGVTLLIGVLLCMTWFTVSFEDDYHRDPVSSDEPNQDEEPGKTKFFDRANPLYAAVAKLRKGNEDTNYQQTYDLADLPANNYKTKVKNNELFQEQEISFEYDNRGYGKDEEELYGHGQANFGNANQKNGANDTQTFLRIPRNEDDGLSDTEI